MTMLPENGKKIIILYILQILRKYTDNTHTMTQQQIMEKLRGEYGLEVNRTTVKRNIALPKPTESYDREDLRSNHRS